ncbi:flagellar type III secretion system pore protein FliP [Salisediminibacterium selenitireducens]|uniref:Flagellar biosynthetic protein FliP n=1 Tax=Bacillus selenitireducens (strain ATCC 700615 / DSM 15326 / MLS10) TaxID=439292 RepID=D6XTX9_BACIE|nr:flagellar type III secretion system pore protein FliP [Salisediminibacterium selenitireducens]ADH99265.1 flagellar biosynthetic protein FliP [[Bacillus] selenitireducens MLS10]
MLLLAIEIPALDIFSDDPANLTSTVQLLLLLTVLSLAPAILILMTSFTRIVIVLSFVRNGLATQQMPPNQVIIGLALFLTFFVMAPTFSEVNEAALQPLFDGDISQEEAFDEATIPMKEFMAQHTRERDLALFMGYAGQERPESLEDIPLTSLVPAFVISELKTAFQIGFMIFVPFLVIDMVVASVLMSMGMMMLPPVMIALPFKVLLFVLVDGWHLVVRSLLYTF